MARPACNTPTMVRRPSLLLLIVLGSAASAPVATGSGLGRQQTIARGRLGQAQVGVDARGNAVAIWAQAQHGTTYLEAATRRHGRQWSHPNTLAHNSAPFGFAAIHLAVDPSGAATAAWIPLGELQLTTATMLRPGRWTKAKVVARSAWAASVATGPHATAAIGGENCRYDARHDRMWCAERVWMRSSTGRWSEHLVNHSTYEQDEEEPIVAMNSGGDVVAASRTPALTYGSGGVVSADFFDGRTQTWAPQQRVSGPGDSLHNPQRLAVAIDSRGNSTLLWEQRDEVQNTTAVQAAWIPNLRQAGPAKTLSSANSDPSALDLDADVALAVNPSGNATAAWVYNHGGGETEGYVPPPLPVGSAQMRAGLWSTWFTERDPRGGLYGAHRSTGGTWQTPFHDPKLVAAGCDPGAAYAGAIGANNRGDVVVVCSSFGRSQTQSKLLSFDWRISG